MTAPGRLSFSGIFVAVLAGAVVGFGVILLGRSRTLFRRITTPEEAAAALGVPVAGVVPRSTVATRRHAGGQQLLLAFFAVALLVAAVGFVWGTIAGVF